MTFLGYITPKEWNQSHRVFVPSNPPIAQVDVEYRRYADYSVIAASNNHGTWIAYYSFTKKEFEDTSFWKHQDLEYPGHFC